MFFCPLRNQGGKKSRRSSFCNIFLLFYKLVPLFFVFRHSLDIQLKAIYIRLGDWSFLNGDKTNFVDVSKHWLSLKSFTNHQLGSPTCIFVSVSCGVMVASLHVDQMGVSSNLRGNSFFSHFYRGLLQNILYEVK